MTESMHSLVEDSWLLFFKVSGMRERESGGGGFWPVGAQERVEAYGGTGRERVEWGSDCWPVRVGQ